MPGRRTIVLLAVWPLLAAPSGPAGPAAVEPEPHAFMADVYQCLKCHEKVPVEGRDDYTTVEYKKDLVTLCEECHRDKVNVDKHPVDIKPEHDVPEGLHLDSYFSITCVTCHDPHGPAFADYPFVPQTWLDRIISAVRGQRRYRTYFLRKSNTEGELCLSCHKRAALFAGGGEALMAGEDQYVGSERCRGCHGDVYPVWKRSLHARFVGNPKVNPGIVLGAFEPGKPFERENLLFTLGEHWTQRYVVTGEKEPMVRPDIWSIQSRQWISSGTYSRSWYRYCAGCHTTGFNPFKGKFVEAGIGCEACHGPGRAHCETTDQFDIINPAKLDNVRRDMICESCHTSGHDRSGLYRFPAGYHPGEDLMKFYRGLIPKPGQEADTYTGDGSYEDRHRQYEYWVSRYNITTGILCDVCKNFRQRPEGASDEIFLSSSEFCATCHAWQWGNYRRHSKHDPDEAECIHCHTPKLSRDLKTYSIHDHKFQFGQPVYGKDLPMEDRCRSCHKGMTSVSLEGFVSGS